MPETREIPVVWIQTATCTGCSVSVLNARAPRITDLLLGEVIPGQHIHLLFQATVMAGSPNSIGAPGRTSWPKAIAMSASAVTTAMVPTLLAGVDAAVMEKGEHMTAWLFDE